MGRIIASTNLGLYEIIRGTTGGGVQARPILKDRYVNFIYNSPSRKGTLYVCTDKGLIVMIQYQRHLETD